jgi:hypothetical protein
MTAALDELRLFSRLTGGLDVGSRWCVSAMPTFLHKAVREAPRLQR